MNHPAQWLTWTSVKPGLSVVAVTVVTGLATIFLRHLAKAGSSPLRISD